VKKSYPCKLIVGITPSRSTPGELLGDAVAPFRSSPAFIYMIPNIYREAPCVGPSGPESGAQEMVFCHFRYIQEGRPIDKTTGNHYHKSRLTSTIAATSEEADYFQRLIIAVNTRGKEVGRRHVCGILSHCQ